jgi:hypothetical protein
MLRRLGETLQHAVQLGLPLGQLQHQIVFRLHRIGQRGQLVVQLPHVALAARPVLLRARHGALQILQVFRRLFQQCLHIGGHGLIAVAGKGP